MGDSGDDDPFVFEDTSHFEDADWAVVNQLKQVYAREGEKGLDRSIGRLAKDDAIRFCRIAFATDPVYWQNAMRDAMAEIGMDEAELRELIREIESPARDQ